MALTRDLVRQGHVTLQVTYLISGPIHAREMIFLFSWLVHQFDITTTSQKKETFLFAVAQDTTIVGSRDLDVQSHTSRPRIWFTCH